MPAWFYQRYRCFFDRLAPAAGLAALFWLTAQTMDVFSLEWQLFIAGSVLLAALIAPIAGYLLFVAAVAYPLYTISIYVAALALSALVILAFFIRDHLAPLVLLLSMPLLMTGRMGLLAPFLAGLWWGEWGGVLVGLGSGLWLKLFAGMCGMSPDLMALGGQPLATGHLIARFQTANSYQTLIWMANPLAPDAQTLLLHVLEILGWGLTGYGVGLMRTRMEEMPRPGVGLVAGVSLGLLGLILGSWAIPVGLALRDTSGTSISNLLDFLVECGWNALIAMGTFGLSRYMRRPVAPSKPMRVDTRPIPAGQAQPAPQPESKPHSGPRPPAWAGPQVREEEAPSDIIMIDLD
ncbi:MAG TPA: hypothetical protein ENN19_06320 [Chloroflexi bacterium]|nr:hypothetical protein [Chloroflexota bacterium]